MRFQKSLDYFINISVVQEMLPKLLDSWMYSGIFVPTLKNIPSDILYLGSSRTPNLIK